MSRMLMLSLVLPASVLSGSFAPWTSDIDPTDIPKRHVQDITTSPFTYNITQGGTMDGKMCTTFPGVWEPCEQTWESNRSLRMENVGATKVIDPWLKIGPIDFFSQQTIANSVTEGLSTDREKALAIFYFYITHRYHKGNGDNTAQGDVSQAMNVFGFNTCGNSTLCPSDLCSTKSEYTTASSVIAPGMLYLSSANETTAETALTLWNNGTYIPASGAKRSVATRRHNAGANGLHIAPQTSERAPWKRTSTFSIPASQSSS
jgi:hypothetical protein